MRTKMMSAAVTAAAIMSLSACRLEHPPTPTAVADSSAIARALSLASVPRLDAGSATTLTVSASRIGGSFATAFEREMAPVMTFANHRDAMRAGREYAVEVEDLQIAEDSAVAMMAESTPEGTSRVRMLLLPRPEGGWRVVSKRVISGFGASERVAMPAASVSAIPPD